MAYASAAAPAELVVDVAGLEAPEVGLSVDFTLAPGEAAFVVGGPGAGKSLMLDALRLVRPARAERFALFGQDARRLQGDARARLRRRIGASAQRPVFFEHLTPAQNVAVPLRLAGRFARDYSREVDEVLDFVGLTEADERPLASLNETARRRTAIARAIVPGPALIIADEPTAGLAPDLALRLLKLLLSMRQTGAAVVIATQDFGLARQFDATLLALDGAGGGG